MRVEKNFAELQEAERKLKLEQDYVRECRTEAMRLCMRLSDERRSDDIRVIIHLIDAFKGELKKQDDLYTLGIRQLQEGNSLIGAAIDKFIHDLSAELGDLPVYNRILDGLIEQLKSQKENISALNSARARKPRSSRFSDQEWMHKIVDAEARKGAKASPSRATNAIRDAIPEDYGGDLPDETTVGRWIKRLQADA